MAVNLKQVAYSQIRSSLLNGKFPAGSTVSPANLAKELGFSRTPIREAINQLETEGFVEQVPRLGHQVRRFDREELAEMFELRQILEQGAARRAAERIAPDEVEMLWELCDQYGALVRSWRDATEPSAIHDLGVRLNQVDTVFHMRLLAVARNRRLVKIVGDLQLMTFLFRRHVEMPRAAALRRWAISYHDHCRIVRALARRDPKAAESAVARHIEGAKAYFLEVFDLCRRGVPFGTDPDQAWSAELAAGANRDLSPIEARHAPRRNRKQPPSSSGND